MFSLAIQSLGLKKKRVLRGQNVINTKPADTICTVCSTQHASRQIQYVQNRSIVQPSVTYTVHTHTHTDRFKLLSITACGIGNNDMLEKGYSSGVVLTLAVVNDS